MIREDERSPTANHLFRWYNSTYTLYAGMIVLYIILLDRAKISGQDLLDDVRKSREILLSMEEASVARRSAELIGEVLEVAKTFILQRQSFDDSVDESRMNPDHYSVNGQTESQAAYASEQDISRTLLSSHSIAGQNRGELLATLIDPTALEDFAAGSNVAHGLGLSTYSMDTFIEDTTMRANDLGIPTGNWWNGHYGNYMFGNHGLAEP